MAATTDQNIALYIGEDRTITFSVTDAAGAAVDLGGATAAWKMYAHPLSNVAALLSKSGSIVGDGSGGQFTVTITDTDTDSINPALYYHEAKVIDASANETIVSTGWVDLRPAKS